MKGEWRWVEGEWRWLEVGGKREEVSGGGWRCLHGLV